MNKADLIEALAPKVGGRVVATEAVESIVDLILREVAAGGSVVVTGFGTFEKVERAARTGRNPRTGEAVPIEATSLPRFRPAAYFKDVTHDPSRLPKDGLAGVRVGSDGSAPVREGAPSSVRKGSQPASTSTRRQAVPAAAGTEEPAPTTPRRRPSTGVPATVRAPKPEKTQEPAPESTAPKHGGLVSGGEEITSSMIQLKKAQLARAKNDAVADAAKGKKSKAKKDEKAKGKDNADSKKGKKDSKKDGKKKSKKG